VEYDTIKEGVIVHYVGQLQWFDNFFQSIWRY